MSDIQNFVFLYDFANKTQLHMRNNADTRVFKWQHKKHWLRRWDGILPHNVIT